jgi:hypothetical protein
MSSIIGRCPEDDSCRLSWLLEKGATPRLVEFALAYRTEKQAASNLGISLDDIQFLASRWGITRTTFKKGAA